MRTSHNIFQVDNRKIYFLLVILLIQTQLFGQEKTEPFVAISPTKMNVFYLGVPNPVDVAVSGIPNEEIRIECDNGSVKGSNGKYEIKPERPGNSTVKVYHKNNLLGTMMFRVKSLPDPIVTWGFYEEEKLTKNYFLPERQWINSQFITNNQVNVHYKNIGFDVHFKVVEYTLTALMITGEYKTISTKGNKLNDDQKKLIESLEPESIIIFEEIKAQAPDGTIRKLQPRTYEIIEEENQEQ